MRALDENKWRNAPVLRSVSNTLTFLEPFPRRGAIKSNNEMGWLIPRITQVQIGWIDEPPFITSYSNAPFMNTRATLEGVYDGIGELTRLDYLPKWRSKKLTGGYYEEPQTGQLIMFPRPHFTHELIEGTTRTLYSTTQKEVSYLYDDNFLFIKFDIDLAIAARARANRFANLKRF